MKLLFKILVLITLSLPCFAQQHSADYHTMMQKYVINWQDTCITHLTTQEIVTIADMLLLSYQVVQASVTMSQARLVIQEELLNIATLSINDTFDASLQAQNNDLTIIKQAVQTIEESQEKIKFACHTLQNFGPLVINIDPLAIQSFIFNLKSVILMWVKTEQETMSEFANIKQEYINTVNTYSHAIKLFEAIIASDTTEHNQLLQGANNLTNIYAASENTIASLTKLRQVTITNFDILLSLYFKHHYQVLYDKLKNIDTAQLYFMATQEHTLPHPTDIFIHS